MSLCCPHRSLRADVIDHIVARDLREELTLHHTTGGGGLEHVQAVIKSTRLHLFSRLRVTEVPIINNALSRNLLIRGILSISNVMHHTLQYYS